MGEIQFFSKTKICVDVGAEKNIPWKLLQSSLRGLGPIHFDFFIPFSTSITDQSGPLRYAHFFHSCNCLVTLDYIQACTEWKAGDHPGLIPSTELRK